MRYFGCSTAGDERRLGTDLGIRDAEPPSTKIGFTLSHSEHAARFLCEAVPKVTEAFEAPFWHFWHPIRLRYLEKYTPSSVLPNYARGSFFTLAFTHVDDF